jgi:uncharacterized membrane protein YkvI
MILRKLPAEKRETAIWYIFTLAQISMAASGILSHFFEDKFPFLIGMLTGLAMVGNLFFLTQVSHLKRPFIKR